VIDHAGDVGLERLDRGRVRVEELRLRRARVGGRGAGWLAEPLREVVDAAEIVVPVVGQRNRDAQAQLAGGGQGVVDGVEGAVVVLVQARLDAERTAGRYAAGLAAQRAIAIWIG
jgi:hypothetical protein